MSSTNKATLLDRRETRSPRLRSLLPADAQDVAHWLQRIERGQTPGLRTHAQDVVATHPRSMLARSLPGGSDYRTSRLADILSRIASANRWQVDLATHSKTEFTSQALRRMRRVQFAPNHRSRRTQGIGIGFCQFRIAGQ